jgi:hypothetical protein
MAHSHQLTRVIKLAGTQAAVKMAREFGGRDYLVPTRAAMNELGDLHPLVVLIGLHAAERLAAEFGGTTLKLPYEVNALAQIRDHSILLRFLEDESIQAIANSLQMDRKAVQQVLDKFDARGLVPQERKAQLVLI